MHIRFCEELLQRLCGGSVEALWSLLQMTSMLCHLLFQIQPADFESSQSAMVAGPALKNPLLLEKDANEGCVSLSIVRFAFFR